MSRRSPVSLQRQMGRILRDQSWDSAISSPALPPFLHEILLIFLLTSISTLHITLPLSLFWPPTPHGIFLLLLLQRLSEAADLQALLQKGDGMRTLSRAPVISSHACRYYLFERPLVRHSVKEKDSSRTWTRATEARRYRDQKRPLTPKSQALQNVCGRMGGLILAFWSRKKLNKEGTDGAGVPHRMSQLSVHYDQGLIYSKSPRALETKGIESTVPPRKSSIETIAIKVKAPTKQDIYQVHSTSNHQCPVSFELSL